MKYISWNISDETLTALKTGEYRDEFDTEVLGQLIDAITEDRRSVTTYYSEKDPEFISEKFSEWFYLQIIDCPICGHMDIHCTSSSVPEPEHCKHCECKASDYYEACKKLFHEEVLPEIVKSGVNR